MLQRSACCTMFMHSEARAALCDCIVPQDITRCVHRLCTGSAQAMHRQTGQEDTIFNMPPEHTQQSANAGCASSVLSAYTRVLAGPKPSVVHDLHLRVHVHLEVDDLHLRVRVHLEVGEPSASSASARFSSARNSAVSFSSWLSASSARFSSDRNSAASFSSWPSFALDSSTKEVSSSIAAMTSCFVRSVDGTRGCCLGLRAYTRRASSCCPSSYL